MGKPTVTLMTGEDFLVSPEMIDTDNVMGFENRMRTKACMTEGCSGRKAIDTMYENTSVDHVENPRQKTTEAPVDLIFDMYPHRRL